MNTHTYIAAVHLDTDIAGSELVVYKASKELFIVEKIKYFLSNRCIQINEETNTMKELFEELDKHPETMDYCTIHIDVNKVQYFRSLTK